MPKSKHGKGRRAQYRNRPQQAIAPAAQAMPTAQGVTTTAAAPAKPVVNTKTAAGRAAAAALQLPHIGAELRNIGILTGIIVVILIVLTFILR